MWNNLTYLEFFVYIILLVWIYPKEFLDIWFWSVHLKFCDDIWKSSDVLWDIWKRLKISPRPDSGRQARACLLLLHLPLLTPPLACTLRELGQPQFQHVTQNQPPIPHSILSVEGFNIFPDIWWAYILRWQKASLLCTMSGFALFLQASRGDCGAHLIAETSFAGNRVPNSWGTNRLTVSVAERNTSFESFDNDTSYNPKHQHIYSHCIRRKWWCLHEFQPHQQKTMLLS